MLRWFVFFILFPALQCFSQPKGCVTAFDDGLFRKQIRRNNTIEKKFSQKEIHKVDIKNISSALVIENGYALAKIKNPENWNPDYKNIKITEIELVFTKYPFEKKNWRTNYYKLLSRRMEELFKLDSRLNCNEIKYTLVLQTGCKSDAAAKKYFHGFLIHYKQKDSFELNGINNNYNIDSTIKIPYSKQVEQFIQEQGGLTDSTAYTIFDRHPEWRKSLVVMDWTSSMYPYGASVVLWHSLHFNQSGIKYYTFFNDGDNKPEYAKELGNAGGIYHEKADNLDEVIKLFRIVKKNGTGGDIPENYIESILAGMKQFPDFNEVILIADNSSCVKDWALVDSIKVPVKIILCGTKEGINPMFLNLAVKTKGSIHTIQEDIASMQETGIGNNHINIGGIDFSKNSDGLYIRTDGKKAAECEESYTKYSKENIEKQKEKEKQKEIHLTRWQKFLIKMGLKKNIAP